LKSNFSIKIVNSPTLQPLEREKNIKKSENGTLQKVMGRKAQLFKKETCE